MKPRKDGETDAHYIKRLEDQSADLKRQNDSLKKWERALSDGVTALAVEGSAAFQLLAEKAEVRSHPSVTAMVELFDNIAHPQWRGDKVLPQVTLPKFWDFDPPGAWSGDADMALNSPLADLIEMLKSYSFFGKVKEPIFKEINEAVGRVEVMLRDGIQGIKIRHGFKPKHLSVPGATRFDAMTIEELREYVSAIGWMALDLAQDMAFANEALRRDLRAATYRRICVDLYGLSQFAIETPEKSNIDIKIVGGEQEPF